MKRKPEPPISEIETYRDVRGFTLNSLKLEKPRCFNGEVQIYRYRVTVRRIKEPRELLIARLQKLWRECDSHYYWKPMHAVAKQFGIKLDNDEFGKDRKNVSTQ